MSDTFHLMIAKKCSDAIINKAKDELNSEKTDVLDFACGNGLISKELCSYVTSIVGVDISQTAVDEYNKNVLEQGNIDENEMKAICLELKESEGDQLNGRKFDLIVCASAYHHIDDIAATTRILASYLNPSGKLIVLDLIKDVKDPTNSDKFHDHGDGHGGGHGKHGTHGAHGDHDYHITHKGGFYLKEIEKNFLDTQAFDDVEAEVAFNFNQFNEKYQKEYTFEYFIVTGKKKVL